MLQSEDACGTLLNDSYSQMPFVNLLQLNFMNFGAFLRPQCFLFKPAKVQR